MRRTDHYRIRITGSRPVSFHSHAYMPLLFIRLLSGITEADIRMQLAEEDDRAITKGDHPVHEVTPAAMLIELLEIEDLQ